MTLATYWRLICETRCTAGAASLVDDPICRSILADASVETLTTGFRGRAWKFEDGSTLIATTECVVVR